MKITLCEGKHLRLVVRDKWEYVERSTATGIVAIIAVTDDQKLVLTEQYRWPVDRRVLELPAGLAGDVAGAEAEDLISAAQRELREETGYEARHFHALFEGPPSAGATSEVIHFFRAIGLRRVGLGGGEGTESIQIHEIPLSAVDQWLQEKQGQGVLIDPKVYAGLYFALSPGAKHAGPPRS
jgi:ADP-ribose pyrophosphatase